MTLPERINPGQLASAQQMHWALTSHSAMISRLVDARHCWRLVMRLASCRWCGGVRRNMDPKRSVPRQRSSSGRHPQPPPPLPPPPADKRFDAQSLGCDQTPFAEAQ